MSVRIVVGDCRAVLKTLPDESVHCCVTSPPYWGLRDYGVDGQLGLEASFQEYVEEMVAVFRDVWRVLRSDGSLWLNLGDSYCSGGRTTWRSGASENKGQNVLNDMPRPAQPNGLKPKDLIGMPWRVAFALQAPQHYGPIRNEADRAWLAALIDGEGTIGIKRDKGRSNGGTGQCQDGYSVFLSIGNQDRELLDKVVAITGFGSVGVKDRPEVDGRGIKSRRTYFGWWISSTQAVSVIRDIFPYLLVKKRQAVLAYNLDLSNKHGKQLRGNGPLPQSEQEKRALLKSLCNACNQRQSVDMPAWLIDPPSNFEQGWYLRSDIIWSKLNPMPESVRDRPTKSHEYIFLMSKSERYYYDAEAIKEPLEAKTFTTFGIAHRPQGNDALGGVKSDNWGSTVAERQPKIWSDGKMGRNRRTVWEIATAPFPEAHFATFPPALIESCIKAGCPEKCCAKCGAPWVREVGKAEIDDSRPLARQNIIEPNVTKAGQGTNAKGSSTWGHYLKPKKTLGFSPSCSCNAGTVAGMVLDCFGGAGTTGLVADRLGRNALLIELNPEYAAMANRRIRKETPLFTSCSVDSAGVRA